MADVVIAGCLLLHLNMYAAVLLPLPLQVRIFKSNLAPLSRIAAHQEACRAVAIAPSDVKFATCSDDQSVKVWDLATCEAERTLTGAPGTACCAFVSLHCYAVFQRWLRYGTRQC
jgi:WD40 repeat protein